MRKQLSKYITIKNVKIAVSIILLTSIFLPFSSCSKVVDKDGKPIPYTIQDGELKRDQNLLADSQIVKSNRYILKTFKVDNLDHWFLIFSFTWPLPIIFLRQHLQKKVFINTIFFAEPVFAVFSSWTIFGESLFGPEIGAITSITSNFILIILWIIEAVISIKNSKLKKV